MSKITLAELASDPEAPGAGWSVFSKAAGIFAKKSDSTLATLKNPADVSTAEAEAGTETATRLWSPARNKEAILALQTKSRTVWSPVTATGVVGNYAVSSVTTSGTGTFTIKVPEDFDTLVSLRLIGIVSAGAAGSGKDIDFNIDWAAVGELFTNHQGSDTGTSYDLTSQSGRHYAFDLSSIVTATLAAGDLVGTKVTHTAIGGNIDYLGLELRYTIT